MSVRTRQSCFAAVMLILAGALGFWSAPSATAEDAVLPIHWNVDASTHLKTLNLDVNVPGGTFDGQVNLTTGALTGNLSLPPATTQFKLFGVPVATATFAVRAAGPITGHVDLATQTVTVNSSFTFLITKAAPVILPRLNLVGNNCRGSQPVTVSFAGKVDLAGASTFTSTYTIPKFTNCGPLTPVLNLVIPGPGNTFTATFAPPPAA